MNLLRAMNNSDESCRAGATSFNKAVETTRLARGYSTIHFNAFIVGALSHLKR